jgi:hypothetical protein
VLYDTSRARGGKLKQKIDFDCEDAVTLIKLKDGTQIRAKFAISVISYDSTTGKYNFELAPPVFQFIKNPGDLNLEVKK